MYTSVSYDQKDRGRIQPSGTESLLRKPGVHQDSDCGITIRNYKKKKNIVIAQNQSTKQYTFPFPYLRQEEVKRSKYKEKRLE